MYKALGAVMVLVSSFALSYRKIEEKRCLFENMKQMAKAIAVMKNEIAFSSADLKDTLSAASSLLRSGSVQKFLKQVELEMDKSDTVSFDEAWHTAKKQASCAVFLSAEADKLLEDFSYRAGKLSREMEVSGFEKTANALEAMAKQEEEHFYQTKKMILSLGVGAGLAVTILFI